MILQSTHQFQNYEAFSARRVGRYRFCCLPMLGTQVPNSKDLLQESDPRDILTLSEAIGHVPISIPRSQIKAPPPNHLHPLPSNLYLDRSTTETRHQKSPVSRNSSPSFSTHRSGQFPIKILAYALPKSHTRNLILLSHDPNPPHLSPAHLPISSCSIQIDFRIRSLQ